jgi:hypothetical protein
LVPLAILFQGCDQEDLAAVESLKPTAEAINRLGSVVMTDIYASCVRSETLDLEGRQIAFDSVSENRFIPVAVIEECKGKDSNAYAANQLNGVLVSYIESLISLANNQTVSFDQNVETLGTSVSTLSSAVGQTASPSLITSSTSIARSLLNMWSASFRRDSLAEVLICTTDPVNSYTSSLISIVRDTYLVSLDEERDMIIHYIDSKYSIIADEFEVDGDVNRYRWQIIDLEVELNSLMEALRQRRENAGIYQQILATTASTHQALASTFRSGMTAEEVTSLCRAYFSSVQSKELSTKPEVVIGSSQLLKARGILKDHILKVDDMIESDPD